MVQNIGTACRHARMVGCRLYSPLPSSCGKRALISLSSPPYQRFVCFLRNSYAPSWGRLRRCRQDLLHRFAPLASSSWISPVNRARRFKASKNPEFSKALRTSLCTCFFLLLRYSSYGMIPDASSLYTASFGMTPPWRPCLDGDSMVSCNEILTVNEIKY
jgi:hypothetical protein